MKTAVWGILSEDVQKAGSPEKVIASCRKAGIETYRPHVYPIRRDPADAEVVWYNARTFQAQVEDLFTPLLEAARRERVKVEPWLLPFDRALCPGETAEDLARRSYRPDPPGNPGPWCPSWPENRARAIARLNDLIESHGSQIAGIHLDAIRYPNAQVSLKNPCHCDACTAMYRQYIGKDTLTADDLTSPGVLHTLVRLRGRHVRTLAEEVREVTNRAGLPLTLAARADYFDWAIPEGQDWVAWARDGLIDLVCPMNYFVDAETHRRHVTQHAKLLRGANVAHYDGLGKFSSFGRLSTADMIAFANDALAAGADGVCIFKYLGLEDEDFQAIAVTNLPLSMPYR